MADTKKENAPASAAPAAAAAPEKRGPNLPKPAKELQGTEQAGALRNWASQYKAGTLTRCDFHAECYYPLVPLRREETNFQFETVTKDGVSGIKARCSYDPEGHGEQVIWPPKKDDEL